MTELSNVVALKTTVHICGHCGKWYGTTINAYSDLDIGDACECGSSFFKNREGRVIGRKSEQRAWAWKAVEECNSTGCYDGLDKDELREYFVFKPRL
jgi:hypothetical protein